MSELTFDSVLVANRGEIACRVFRTARRLGLRTVAVYSDADAEAPHVAMADAAVRLGPAPARESYLRGDLVIQAALETGAQAIHPGYGFLSENAEFAEAVTAAGLVWIGPPPSAIRAMGLKDAAKRLMAEAGVPVTPGYLGDDQSPDRLQAEADAIGYPVLIKAVAGGGGKGMKKVEASADFADALSSAKREAAAAFGDDRVLIEKYVTRPRHIEVQVFGDQSGDVVHLFERDCSLQRRHQKVVEEAPAPGMDAATRAAVTEAAVRAAKAVGYVGAGTVEFIADASEGLRGDRVYFMEMNTRLQVEHPVTEMITGQDLVEWQLRVASGLPLPLAQDALRIDGWAMEARLYAEDPAKGFLPSIGPLEHFVLPDDGEIRIDTGVEPGGEVSQFYDPMIAKLIVHADTREEAARRLAEACREVQVWPVRTNAAFLARCLEHPDFVAGEVDTAFIPSRQDALVPTGPSPAAVLAALGMAAEHAAATVGAPVDGDPYAPWQATPEGLYGFRLNAPPRTRHRVEIDGREVEGEAAPELYADGTWRATSDAATAAVDVFPQTVYVDDREAGVIPTEDGFVLFDQGLALAVREVETAGHGAAGPGEASGKVLSPMPGRIVAVQASEGATVAKGAPLVVLEAMKMEHTLTAPFDGVVRALSVKAGDQVSEGVALVVVEAAT